MKNNKKLKGFTLIELIIVMAIFGVLMVAAMSIITPLNRIAKKASLQEANSAAVDNVKRYMEGSLRYSDCIEVYVGGLTDVLGNNLTAVGGKTLEETAVKNFLNNHYTNRTDPGTDDPLTGKVRLLKIDNNNQGKIEEYEWDFTAGYTYYTVDYTASADKNDVNGRLKDSSTGLAKLTRVDPVLKQIGSVKNVINDVYYRDYSFYFVPGYNTTELVTDSDELDNAGFTSRDDDEGDTYYSKIVPEESPTGHQYADFSADMFSLSVVTYKNDDAIGIKPDDASTPAVNEKEVIVKSPAALSNINMSLVNINSAFSGQNISSKYGRVRYSGNSSATEKYDPKDIVDIKPSDGNCDYELITTDQATLINNRFFKSNSKNDDDCIYFIYTLPNMM